MAKLEEIVVVKKQPAMEDIVLKLSMEELLGAVEGLDPITVYVWSRKFDTEEFDNYMRRYGAFRADNTHKLRGSNEEFETARRGFIIGSFKEMYGINCATEQEDNAYMRLLEMHYSRMKRNKPQNLSGVPLGTHYFLMRMAYFEHIPLLPKKVARESQYFLKGKPKLKRGKAS